MKTRQSQKMKKIIDNEKIRKLTEKEENHRQ